MPRTLPARSPLIEASDAFDIDAGRRRWLGRALAAAWLLAGPATIAADSQAPAAADPNTDPEAAIRAVLTEQADAWNRGDIDRFMSGYWHDERLRFASGGKVTHGWQTTLDGYKTRYPDRATMGTLSFTEIEIESTGPDSALAFGRWALAREKDRPNGLFSLLFRRTADGWKITRDHTSSDR